MKSMKDIAVTVIILIYKIFRLIKLKHMST